MRILVVAALIVLSMLAPPLVSTAEAAVEVTDAAADQRLSQAEAAFRSGRPDEATRLLWEVTNWANGLSSDPSRFAVEIARKRTASAERMYQRVLATIGRTFGADHQNAWDALVGLATLYREQRRFAEAESLLLRALSIAQRAPRPQDRNTFGEGRTVIALATLYERQGRNAETEAAYRRAADLFDMATPPATQNRDEALLRCALLLRSAGRRAEAAELEARMLPENRATVARIEARNAWDAAMAEARAGRKAEAEQIFKGVVRDAEARGDPILKEAVSALLLYYIGTGNEEQIRILCERYPTIVVGSPCPTAGAGGRPDPTPVNPVAPLHRGHTTDARPVPPTEQPLDVDTINAGRNPDDPRIRKLVAYFAGHELTLIEAGNGAWRVAQAAFHPWDLVVNLRSFPAAATEAQMRGALERISLAYRLNARAHLAMSYAHYQGIDRDSRGDESHRKELNEARERIDKTLAELFLQYVP